MIPEGPDQREPIVHVKGDTYLPRGKFIQQRTVIWEQHCYLGSLENARRFIFHQQTQLIIFTHLAVATAQCTYKVSRV